jgi:cell division septal protein FtsQ
MRLVIRENRKRLRKQPRKRRVYSTGSRALPGIVVPPKNRKRRARRWLRQLPLGAVRQVVTSSRWFSLMIVLMCVGALSLASSADDFYLGAIPVEGAQAIPASELVAASGLAGRHIFAADPVSAAGRLGQVPGVVSATVTLHWPNHAAISIAEETPVAIWQQGGQRFWVNAKGELTPARGSAAGLVVVVSDAAESVGENTFVPADVLNGALQLKALRPNIDRLSYAPGKGLTYQDGRGWLAHFGTGDNMDQKLVVYESIVEQLLNEGITPEYVGAGNQARPYYKPVGN